MAIGIIVAIPLGILLTRTSNWLSSLIITIVSIIQTIPSLAFFAFVIPFLGTGATPAIVALFLYSLLPILRNTYIGVRSVDPALIDASRGQGMTSWEILYMVELPLSAPIIVAGIRLSSIYIVSWATLAYLIGGGGLGVLIDAGLAIQSVNYLLAGAIPAALLAFIAGLVFAQVRRLVTPRGLKADVGVKQLPRVEVVTG